MEMEMVAVWTLGADEIGRESRVTGYGIRRDGCLSYDDSFRVF